MTLVAPGEVRAGRRFLALALVSHAGPAPLDDARVTLAYDRAGPRILTPAARHLGALRPGRWRWAVWALVAKAPGDYVLVARAEGRDRATGEPVAADSPAVLVHAR